MDGAPTIDFDEPKPATSFSKAVRESRAEIPTRIQKAQAIPAVLEGQ
jgi:hypothetical protein